MNGTRLLACLSAVAAAGCLWLFPIQEEATKASGGVTGIDGSIAAAGAGGTSATTGNDAGGCVRNEDCGDPSTTNKICRAQKCVTWLTNECLVPLGNWNDPNPFIFGAYAYEPVNAPQETQWIYNYDLAIQEINAAGGLPDSNNVRHPLAAVVCNNDPKQSEMDFSTSLRHLVDHIGVSAIVADLPPVQLVNASTSEKSLFLLSPGPTNNDLLKLPSDALVWNMLGPPSDLADGYADLVGRIEKYVNASDAGTTPLRVAVVLKDDPTDAYHELWTELYAAVKNKLSFNGGQLATKQLGGNYVEFKIDASSDAGMPAAIGDAINAFAPHIVISMTGSDFTKKDVDIAKEGVAQSIITRVNGIGGSSRAPWVQHEYPFFIFSPVASVSDVSTLLMSSTAHTFPVLYQRFLGIDVAGADDREILRAYQTRLHKFQPAAIDGFENYYDSIYYLAYAVYQQGVEPIDGRKIDLGMRSLTSGGRPEKVGPMELIDSVFQDLKGAAVLLRGASGSEFNGVTRARINKAGLYCFQNVNFTPTPLQPAEIFDAHSHMWNPLYPDTPCAPGL